MTPEAPGFSARGGFKDATHIQKLAKASGAPMPVADVVVGHLKEVTQRGGADSLDWVSSVLLLREQAGIEDKQELLEKKP